MIKLNAGIFSRYFLYFLFFLKYVFKINTVIKNNDFCKFNILIFSISITFGNLGTLKQSLGLEPISLYSRVERLKIYL